MRHTFIRCLIENGISLVATFLQCVIMRWMLELSKPKEDLKSVSDIWRYLKELSWYRGTEYFHQLKFWRVIHDSYQC
jgi:hypothetical protein